MAMLETSLIIDFSLIITALGIIFFYFGKIIADNKVEKHENFDFYIEGFLFLAIYIYIPLIFTIYLFNKNWILPINIGWIIIFQIIILSMLSFSVKISYYLLKHGLIDEFKKKFNKIIEELKNSNSLKGQLLKKSGGKILGIDLEYFVLSIFDLITKTTSNSKIMLFVSFILIYSTFLAYTNHSFLGLSLIGLFTFINLTLLAIIYSFSQAYYPPSKITLEDKTIISGKILKYGEFVYLLDGDKKIFINKDKIIKIENSLFKEQETKNERKPKTKSSV